MSPDRLTGGNINDVIRSGETVVRSAGPWTPTIHRLLHHLRKQGLDWVPAPFGTTPDGRELVQFFEGDVPSYPMPAWIWDESVLIDAARKLRALHDATIEYADPDAIWRQESHQPVEVICHNDFAPYNMVFESETCVGVIDFDMASPGPRLWDLAYLAYRIVPLTSPSNPDGIHISDAIRTRRLDMLIDTYELPCGIPELIDMTIIRLDELAHFSEQMATVANRPKLRDHAALYRDDAAWLRDFPGLLQAR